MTYDYMKLGILHLGFGSIINCSNDESRLTWTNLVSRPHVFINGRLSRNVRNV